MGRGKRTESNGDMEMIVRESLAGSEGAKRGWLEVGMGEDIRGIKDCGLKINVMAARGDHVETVERRSRQRLSMF